MTSKAALRKRLKTRRKRLRRTVGRPLHGESLLPHWPDSFADLSVAGYYPTDTEFDVMPLLQTLRLAGVATGLPRIRSKSEPLEFKLWQQGEALRAGPFDIKQPVASAPPFTPHIILCPLLGFDARGGRIGYGGGYYDRTLAAMPAALAIGIAFDEQEVDALPREPHDQLLDAVLTPSGLRDFSTARLTAA